MRSGEAEDFLYACLEAWHDGNFTALKERWPDYELFEAKRYVAHQLFGAMIFNGLMANGMPSPWYEPAEAAIEADDVEKQIDILTQAVEDVLPHYSEEYLPLWLDDAIFTLSIIRPDIDFGNNAERCEIIDPSFR